MFKYFSIIKNNSKVSNSSGDSDSLHRDLNNECVGEIFSKHNIVVPNIVVTSLAHTPQVEVTEAAKPFSGLALMCIRRPDSPTCL